MRIKTRVTHGSPINRALPTMLFDLQTDPDQEQSIRDEAVERGMIEQMLRLMKKCDAPSEQYERLGLNPAGHALQQG